MSFKFGTPGYKTPVESEPVRSNFEDLAVNHFTAKENYPENPRNGMIRVFQRVADAVELHLFFNGWIKLLTKININTNIAIRQEKEFTNQATWTFAHGLEKMPMVQVFDSGGSVIYPEDIVVNENNIVITHSIAMSGKIIVVG